MDKNKKAFLENQGRTIQRALEKRSITSDYVATAEEAKALALSRLNKTGLTTWGGSMTLQQMGLIDALKKEGYSYLDRKEAAPDQVDHVLRQAFTADTYLMSTNAITLDGKLINIDGNGNRVAAMIFGPKNVLIIAGMNKVARNEEEGIWRVHHQASPPNTLRLNKQTPCASTGTCHQCLVDDCICCQTVVTRKSRVPGRIHVILIGQELGY